MLQTLCCCCQDLFLLLPESPQARWLSDNLSHDVQGASHLGEGKKCRLFSRTHRPHFYFPSLWKTYFENKIFSSQPGAVSAPQLPRPVLKRKVEWFLPSHTSAGTGKPRGCDLRDEPKTRENSERKTVMKTLKIIKSHHLSYFCTKIHNNIY